MADKYENVIRQQAELIAGLMEQNATDEALIEAQKQQIRAQQEEISLLEKENRRLVQAGNELSAACERLDRLCHSQQELLDSFCGIFSGK